MKKLFFVFSYIFISLIIFSCATASGTALVTGIKREATIPEQVIIYTEAPQNYEVVGIVTAASDAGKTEQDMLNYAIAELKKQAAKIGANGVIIEDMDLSSGGFVMFYGVAVPIAVKEVSGKAIFVNEN
ncbi:hypothetical protein [Treponema sp. C6A8]|uniref:hypothetical protein n=1 Tax=Treponema sp. C6A8 TaxID=1410609 RepID=UPI00048200DC|nr:hypothetical protein [Treponema sp. C6A8]